jgi:Vacuolar-sorting-associated 13 protein C-terminal
MYLLHTLLHNVLHCVQAVLSAAGIGDTSNSDDTTDDNNSSNSSSKCDTIQGIGGIPGNVFIGGNGPPKLQSLEHLKIAMKLANAQQAATPPTIAATLTADTPPLKLYLEKFEIAPIQLHLSFTLAAAAHHAADSSGNHGVHSAAVDHTGDDTVSTGLASSSTSSSTAPSTAANPLFLLVKAMGATLANIENAPLHMRQVSIRDKLASPQQLVALLIGHYTRQALGQAYKIVGSAELLGNPIGLLQSLGAGVSCSM